MQNSSQNLIIGVLIINEKNNWNYNAEVFFITSLLGVFFS
jgi:hypothetical protein